MAEPLRPTAAPTHGKRNWVYVPTIAAQGAPTVAEVTAAASLDFSRIAFASGAPSPTQNTNRVTAEKRFADTTLSEFIGDTQYQGGEMTYSLSPQAAAMADGKKMYEKIPAGTTGFLVRRLGVTRSTALAAGQFVDVFPVSFGPSIPVEQGDAESGEAAAMCTYAVTGEPSFVVAIAA